MKTVEEYLEDNEKPKLIKDSLPIDKIDVDGVYKDGKFYSWDKLEEALKFLDAFEEGFSA